jgi:hypothetical protein
MRNVKVLMVLLAAGLALSTPFIANAKKGGGGGESQAGGLPALEDRVEADEALITALQGQNQFAVVNTDGTLARGTSGASSTHIGVAGTGTYEVDFGTKDVSGCAFVATLGAPGVSTTPPVGEISVASDADGVFIQTSNSAGAPADASFHLYVSCP